MLSIPVDGAVSAQRHHRLRRGVPALATLPGCYGVAAANDMVPATVQGCEKQFAISDTRCGQVNTLSAICRVVAQLTGPAEFLEGVRGCYELRGVAREQLLLLALEYRGWSILTGGAASVVVDFSLRTGGHA